MNITDRDPNPKQIAPGPKGRFLTGSLAERKKDKLGFLLRTALEFGPVARIKFGPRLTHLVSHPDCIKQVLLDSGKNYIKGANYDCLRPFLGNGLLTSEGDYWKRQR